MLRYSLLLSSLAPSAAQPTSPRPGPRPLSDDISQGSVPLTFTWAVPMPFSHQISAAERRARLDCGTLNQLDELDPALDSLLGEADFQRSFNLLVELGRDGPILECAHALAVADAFGSRRDRLQGRVALYAPGERGRIAARFIAMIGRHQGLRMEAFRERAWAEQWLGGPIGRSA